MFLLLAEFPYSNLFGCNSFYFIGASTDSVDGYIARKRNEVTSFGKFIDPWLIKFGYLRFDNPGGNGQLSSVIAIIIITREFVITGFRMLAASEGVVIAASGWGKLKTILRLLRSCHNAQQYPI